MKLKQLILIAVALYLTGCTGTQWNSVCQFKTPECEEWRLAQV